MWKNYLKTAIRNFARNRIYSILNLGGLTLGLVSSMLIFQYVIFENSADGFHAKKDRLYRVAFERFSGGDAPQTFSQFFLGAGEAFKQEITAIENLTRIRADYFQEGPTITNIRNGEKSAFKDVRSIIVDTTFFEVFTFPLVKGDQETALKLPASILITESMARRIFGNEDPIGKTVDYSMTQGPQSLQVTGIIKDVPDNSHIQFDVIVPLQNFMGNIPDRAKPLYAPWVFREFTTYVGLAPGANVKNVEASMTQIIDRNIGESLNRQNLNIRAKLQPMESLYFDRETDMGFTGFGSALAVTRTGNERMVYFFTVIAIITLSIALISYINLSTIRSFDRAKEVGVRKVIGAQNAHLRLQFFTESVIMNVMALIIAILLVMLLTPSFNEFAKTNFTWSSWINQTFLLVFGGVFIAGVLLSGLYPAFILSSFKPIAALKSKVNALTSPVKLRKFFVVLQYAPAIALLICTIVVYTQLDFMRNMDIGLEMDRLITIRSPRFLPEGMVSSEAERIFKDELKKLSVVTGTSFTGNQAGLGLNFVVPFEIDSLGESGFVEFKGSGVDQDFVDVFGLKLLAGEPFTIDMAPTYGDPKNFIRKVLVNETAIKNWGFKNNQEAVGNIVSSVNQTRYYILGVLEDFNWGSVHHATVPVMLWYTPANRFISIKFSSGVNFENAISQVRDVYDRLFPEDVFHYEFADDVYASQYGEDEKFANLFGIFSGTSMLIASLGLFGLSAFSAERRSREVGIRKVMGATDNQIIGLLSKEFVVLVVIAFVVASPVAWMVMQQWLKGFAFRIDLDAIPFVITAVGSILIAILTVSLKTMSVANRNPVKTLRTE